MERKLQTVTKDLEAALAHISEGRKPVMKQLSALLLSKGIVPPSESTRPALEALRKEAKETSDWKRSVRFTPSDQKKLDSISETETQNTENMEKETSTDNTVLLQ